MTIGNKILPFFSPSSFFLPIFFSLMVKNEEGKKRKKREGEKKKGIEEEISTSI